MPHEAILNDDSEPSEILWRFLEDLPLTIHLAWRERRSIKRCRPIGFFGTSYTHAVAHRAAGVAEAKSRRALETAQRLSSQLHAAQDRIAELEAELQLNRDRANRAEEWLSKISMEIEDRLVNQPEEKRRQVSRQL